MTKSRTQLIVELKGGSIVEVEILILHDDMTWWHDMTTWHDDMTWWHDTMTWHEWIDFSNFFKLFCLFYSIKALELLGCRLNIAYTMIVQCWDDGMQKPRYGATLALVLLILVNLTLAFEKLRYINYNDQCVDNAKKIT